MTILFDQNEIERVSKLVARANDIDREVTLHRFHDLNQVLPARDATLIRLLAEDKGEYRQFAQELLIERSDSAFDTLCWGTHYKPSLEVRETCKRLRNRLYICRDCSGTGLCPQCRGKEEISCNFCDRDLRHCKTCRGEPNLKLKITSQ